MGALGSIVSNAARRSDKGLGRLSQSLSNQKHGRFASDDELMAPEVVEWFRWASSRVCKNALPLGVTRSHLVPSRATVTSKAPSRISGDENEYIAVVIVGCTGGEYARMQRLQGVRVKPAVPLFVDARGVFGRFALWLSKSLSWKPAVRPPGNHRFERDRTYRLSTIQAGRTQEDTSIKLATRRMNYAGV
jgi:hypothetical protein